jgi:nicotinamidase-related amidase
VYEKSTFSMVNEECRSHLTTMKSRTTVVLYGFETHICINATCLDLM